jgi:hypothetical protein
MATVAQDFSLCLASQAGKETVIWFIWFVSFVWLNQTNQINKTNQINLMNETDRACLSLAV